MASSQPARQAGREYLLSNYLLHAVEGAFYMAALGFVSPETVLPSIVRSLGGASWLIAVVPLLGTLAWIFPMLMTAHLAERFRRTKPLINITSLFQRIPFLLAGLALLLLWDTRPALTLAVVVLAPSLTGMIGGISAGSWFALTSRCVPVHRRASCFALRHILAGTTGLGVGYMVRIVLEQTPGTDGYGILHMYAFAMVMISALFFWLIRETNIPGPEHDKRPERGMRDNISGIPGILRTDRAFRRFLVDRITAAGMFIMLPFLAIHALGVLGKNESFLGYFIQAQMLGGIAGNIAAGVMGDKSGGRVVLLTSRAILMVVCLCAGWNTSAAGFFAVFFLQAAGMHMANIGSVTLGFDLSPEGRVPTYVAVMHIAMLPGMLIAVGLSAVLRETGWPYSAACLLSLATQAVSLAAVLRLREPRRRVPAVNP